MRHPPHELGAWGGAPPPWLEGGDEPAPAGVRTRIGGDGLELLDADPRPRCLIKSPGIPFDHPLIATALERGLTVIDEAELGWRLDCRPVVGVTGTNGKSTVVALIAAVLEAVGTRVLVGGNTQFDPPLSALTDREGDVLVAEISSFQLEGSPELLPEAAVLTNLARHHLLRHGTVERYAELKRRLFVRGERAVKLAVLNVDDPFGRRLAEEVRERGGTVAGFGTGERADYRVDDLEWTLDRAAVRIVTPAGPVDLETRLPGRHNALNVAAALAFAGGIGLSIEQAGRAIEQADGPPGRFEIVHRAPPFDVLVSEALSAHALRAVLEAVREAGGLASRGRVIALLSALDVVNDLEEQREMGRIARAATDLLILTTERWQPGEPKAPVPGLVEGAHRARGGECELVPDRRTAIDRAISAAREGDVVLVLGRGARRGHLLDAQDRPRRFSDRDETRAALNARGIDSK